MTKKIIVTMILILISFLVACGTDGPREEQAIEEEESGYESLAASAYMTGMA